MTSLKKSTPAQTPSRSQKPAVQEKRSPSPPAKNNITETTRSYGTGPRSPKK